MEHKSMVQYGVMPNCCNNCQFCLREERTFLSKKDILRNLDMIKTNIKSIDWKNDFTYGVSLLGGELYFMEDKDYQESFLELIDVIIEYVLKVSDNPNCRYSTVTNGLYNPEFLYKVIDKIVNACGIGSIDVNFSYDLKYRFKNEEDRKLVLKNINDFHKRYDYCVGVQMILTQYLINMWKNGEFDVNKFMNEDINGNMLCLLYPHPIKTGIKLDDFFFNRNDFLEFLTYLKNANYDVYMSFLHSTKNSCSFKYTGLKGKNWSNNPYEKPVLTDGKEIPNPNCGHSILYKCYSDCDNCILCDLNNLDSEVYL